MYGGHKRYLQYKVARRNACKLQVENRRRYERVLAKNIKLNPKAYFNYVQSKPALRNSVGNVVSELGNKATDAVSKANVLFTTFESIYRADSGREIQPTYDPDVPTMQDLVVQSDEVRKQLSCLIRTKSPGPDGIHPAILKPLAELIAQPLAVLYNTSLTKASLPEDWKLSAVTPIHKGGSREIASNYRPVSLTSVVLKVLERIISEHIVGHLTTHNLLAAEQHGFVKKKSCLTNLMSFLNEITKRLDKGETVEVCYLDFQKAFDSVNHRFLMKKLTTFKLADSILDWISQFLKDRKFFVTVEGYKSKIGLAKSGVPQGSVLGPLLFLMYINDLVTDLENPCYMFADDVKIVGNPTESSIQRDLTRISSWATLWDLPLNASKCQHLLSAKSSAVSRYLGEQSNQLALPSADTVKDLGIQITSDLTPSAQCQAAVKRANQALYSLRRTISSREPEVLLPLYKTIVRPHLEYCVQAWCPYLIKDIKLLEKTQRRFTRWFKHLKGRSYKDRLKALGLFSLQRRRLRGDLIEVFKLLNGLSNPGSQLLELSDSTQLRGNIMKLTKKRVRSRQRAQFFTERVVNHWNKLPNEVVQATSVPEFKSKLDAVWEQFFAHLP
jgi:ribonuclease P/MRP protein subunit RPP40